MKRSFKKIETEGKVYLYPIPVIKDHKYLILCDTEEGAEKILNLINTSAITHPDESGNNFVIIGHHTDGKTAILQYKN